MVATARRPSIVKSAARSGKQLSSPKHAQIGVVGKKAVATPAAAASKKPSSRRSSVQRSVPSSPQQKAAEAPSVADDIQHAAASAAAAADAHTQDAQQQDADMGVEEFKEQSEVPTAASSSSAAAAAPSAEADAAATESEPVLTPEEQKMFGTIQTVRQRLDQIESQLPTLRGQLELHAARLCAFRLARHYRSPTLNANKLLLSHKSLRYNAGLIDEQTMQAIFKLDSLQTDSAFIRKERKATVARGNKIIAESVELCKKIDKLRKWVPEKEEEPEQSIADVMTDEQHTPEPPADAHMRPDTPDSGASTPTSHASSSRPTSASTRPASPAAAAAPAAQSAAAAPAAAAPELHPLQRKYAHLRLPTWRGPQFVSRVHPHSGALMIQADLSGVRSDDVSVSSDAEARKLTIRGVQLPRRRSVPSAYGFFGFAPPMAQEPYGYFEKVIDFNSIDPQQQYQLAGMNATMDADGQLTVFVPRQPVARRAPAQPQPHTQRSQPLRRPAARAEPVHFTSGYEDVDEEDDEPAYFSQPHHFYPGRQAPRAAPQYSRPMPFFGGGGWW